MNDPSMVTVGQQTERASSGSVFNNNYISSSSSSSSSSSNSHCVALSCYHKLPVFSMTMMTSVDGQKDRPSISTVLSCGYIAAVRT